MPIRLSTESSSSSYGIPVFIDSEGNPMNYTTGIRAMMSEHKLTQRALARILHCSPRTVEDWRSGRRMPSNQALLIMAQWLDAQQPLQTQAAPEPTP